MKSPIDGMLVYMSDRQQPSGNATQVAFQGCSRFTIAAAGHTCHTGSTVTGRRRKGKRKNSERYN